MKDKTVLVADYGMRFIWLDGTITSTVARRFGKMVERFNKNQKSSLPIYFYIRGLGGVFNYAIQIIEAIEESRIPITIIAHNRVRSAHFIITQSGNIRLARPGTRFIFHPSASTFKVRKGKEVLLEQRDIVQSLENSRTGDFFQMAWFLRRGRPIFTVISLFREGATIEAEKAIELRLIDGYFNKAEFSKHRSIVRNKLKGR